ncbi:hypothetical protein FEP67_03797 [Burkholderia multivorans]|nr:hypothetical protein [Burkholderia multivorans]
MVAIAPSTAVIPNQRPMLASTAERTSSMYMPVTRYQSHGAKRWTALVLSCGLSAPGFGHRYSTKPLPPAALPTFTISTNRCLPFGSAKFDTSLPFSSVLMGCMTITGFESLIEM